MAGRLLLLMAALLAGLGLTEGGLRLYAHLNPRIGNQLREWDPVVSTIELMGNDAYRPRPGAEFHYANGAVSHINPQGFRGPQVAIPKPPGTFRVVLLGGSTTHGAGVSDDETLDAHLRRVLAVRYPGRGFDVVNLGFDAYDSDCDYERLSTDGLPLEPDVVVIHSGINDVLGARTGLRAPHEFEPALARMRRQRQGAGFTPWERAKHWLYVARAPGLLRRTSTGPQPGPPAPPPGGTGRFARNLRRTAGLIPPETVLLFSTPPSSLRFPSPPQSGFRGMFVVDDKTTQRYRDALDTEMRAAAAEVAAAGRPAVYVPHDVGVGRFLDDCHLTSEGNRQVAEDLADALEPFLAGRRSP